MVLVIADIDQFKFVNDRHGHRTGDLVLQMIGNTMAATCPIMAGRPSRR
jgi:diguanylate cyclase (GGDEF)-like protein